MKHVLSVDQFDRTALEELFKSADAMRELVQQKGGDSRFSTRVAANLFYEPSTRTFSSFATAMYRLGGNVIPITDVKNSSVAKGETLEDTIRMLAGYADVIVMRHSEVGAGERAAAVSNDVPIINAGEGTGDHPTQALLDAYTIYRERGTIDGLTVTMLGDLKYGRCPHSLAKLLNNFDVTLEFVSPEELQFPIEIQAELTNTPAISMNLDGVIAETDVLYVTRVQKERITDQTEYEKIKDAYVVDKQTLAKMKSDAIIMHPLPRVNEITTDVDSDPRSAYFRQAENGLYIRMALFDMLINK